MHWITNKDVEPSDEHAQDLLSEPNVKHWSHTRLMSIDGDASGVTGCHVQQRGDETPQELPVDGVFIYVAGCACDASAIVKHFRIPNSHRNEWSDHANKSG